MFGLKQIRSVIWYACAMLTLEPKKTSSKGPQPGIPE